MNTHVLSATDPKAVSEALVLLQAHHVIGVPTDTVYGLVCRFDSVPAMEQLYEIKGRPPQKALPVLLGDPQQLERVVQVPLPEPAHTLIERFWPGPLTLVLPALERLPAILIAGGDTVAVRMPDHDLLRQIARQAGPLASSSANRSGQPAAATADQVLAQLCGRIPLLLDGGATAHTVASTVLDLSGDRPRILREGPLDREIRLCCMSAAGGTGP